MSNATLVTLTTGDMLVFPASTKASLGCALACAPLLHCGRQAAQEVNV